MKIKRYSIRDETTIEDIKAAGGRDGGTWVNKKSKMFLSKHCEYKPTHFEFSIDIAFNDDLTDWNDWDYVLVLDEDFCQPYTPFYGDNFGAEISNFPTLEYCVEKYNEFMDSLPFMVGIKE